MNTHTLSENVAVKPLLDPEARTADVNSASIDTLGYDGCLFILHIGAHDRTTGDETLDGALQESSDDGSADAFAPVTGGAFAQIGNVVPDATKGNAYLLDVRCARRERFLRIAFAKGGTTPSTAYGLTAILYRGAKAPVSQDAPVVKV